MSDVPFTPRKSQSNNGFEFVTGEHTISDMSDHSQSSNTEISGSSSSTVTKKFRPLAEIYDATAEIELTDELIEDLMFFEIEEPVNYVQAAKDSAWRQAMINEINAIEKNQTWKLVELPAGQKPIGLKWVYKLKRDSNGEITKHKARLVAKGYVQKHGIDYEEVFASVTRLEIVKLLLALAAKNGWEVHHLDVKSAFLNGELQETVYVCQPEGFIKKGS